MTFLFYTIHVMICLFLILVVLLQQGKGADLSVFGGGGTMTAFGARGAATLLHKMTVIGFVGFIFTTLAIGILQKQSSSSSVMSDVPAVEAEAPAVPAEEAAGALPEDDAEAALPGDAAAALEDGTEAAAEGDAGDEIQPETEEFDESAAVEEEGGGEDS